MSTSLRRSPQAIGQEAIAIRMKGNLVKLSFASAYSYGHTLLRGDRIDSATLLFEHLARLRPKDRRVSIMLARCKARGADYPVCRHILDEAFGEDGLQIADQLHSAFVYRAVGLFPEAKQELRAVVEAHPDVPSACLALGDLFEKVGREDKAAQLWKLAARRDEPDGLIAQSVKSQLSLLGRSRASN